MIRRTAVRDTIGIMEPNEGPPKHNVALWYLKMYGGPLIEPPLSRETPVYYTDKLNFSRLGQSFLLFINSALHGTIWCPV